MKRNEILDEVKKIICGDRDQQYGTPENNFAEIAKLWTDYLGRNIDALDVAIMMALFKIARIKTGVQKDDSFIDAAGYIACAAEIASENSGETETTEDDQQTVVYKCDDTCNKCRYGRYNGCEEKESCKECEVFNGCRCLCTGIGQGDICPYFEEWDEKI